MDLTEKHQLTKYDFELLNTIMYRDNSTIRGEYESLNVYSVIEFICNCGKEGSKKFRSLYGNGGAFCKDCAKINGRNKSEATNLERFGVKNIFASKEIQDKIKKNNMDKYGVEHNMQRKDIVDKIKDINKLKTDEEKKERIIKIKETLIQRYGVENASQSEIVKKKKEETLKKNYGVSNPSQSDIIKKRKENTNLANHGVKNVFQNEQVKRKAKETTLLNHGVEHIMQSEANKQKVKKTNIRKYGVEHPSQCLGKEETSRRNEKRKNTCIERFGVENPMQDTETLDKMQKSSFNIKEYKMPSGNIRKVQGYEPFALDDLIKIYTEEQILTNRKEVGRIQYEMENKRRYYFPDIFIPHENKYIEVKSRRTYDMEPEEIKCKGDACKSLGFDYEIWIYNRKGQKEVVKF
jgi:hypothetical protein